MKLVSIIIPTWNRAAWVADAIQSALEQTYPDIEIIVVDDGSTDTTREVVTALADNAEYPIRFFLLPHGGISRARQYGVEQAHGEFIQFLDSDDVLRSEKIARQMARISTSETTVDCCLTRARKGNVADGWNGAEPVSVTVTSGEEALAVLAGGVPYAINTMTPLWRTAFLLEQPPWPIEFSCGEDLVWFVRLFQACGAVVSVDEPLVWLRDHADTRATDSGSGGRQSAVLARMTMVEELRRCQFWKETWADGCVRQLRTAYRDALDVLNDEDLIRFEFLLLDLIDVQKKKNWMTLFLIQFRRRCGRCIVRFLVDVYLQVSWIR